MSQPCPWRKDGAGEGNRTPIPSLGSWYSATELHPLYSIGLRKLLFPFSAMPDASRQERTRTSFIGHPCLCNAGFPLKACGNDMFYGRLPVQLVFVKTLTQTSRKR